MRILVWTLAWWLGAGLGGSLGAPVQATVPQLTWVGPSQTPAQMVIAREGKLGAMLVCNPVSRLVFPDSTDTLQRAGVP